MGCAMMGFGGWGLLAAIVPLVVLALVIAVGVWLGRRLGGLPGRSHSGEPTGSGDADGAREVLRRRYAAGEIDDEEFERRLAGLNFR